MKSIVSFVFLSLNLLIASGQLNSCKGFEDLEFVSKIKSGLIGFEYFNPVKGYRGNQYFNNWTYGEVQLSSGIQLNNIMLQYDKYLDQLLWLRENDLKIGVLNKNTVTGFQIFSFQNRLVPEASFIKMKINLAWKGQTDVFLQVLVIGEIGLYAFRNVKIISSTDNELGDNTQYLIISGGKQYQVLLKRRSLLNIPVIQKAEMKALLRSSGIDIYNSEVGLIKAIEIYNEKHK